MILRQLCSRRSVVVGLAMLAGSAGCVREPWLASPPPPAAPPPYVNAQRSSPTEVQQVSGRFKSPQQARVDEVGRKLLAANTQAALKPSFQVTDEAALQITHQADHRIVVSASLVNACNTDAHLAALLALEMGRMVADRQTQQDAASLENDRLPPMDISIGPDGGGFGPQARQAELAKLGYQRRRPGNQAPAPDPEALARQYLGRAGFAASNLDEVAPLRQASTPAKR